MTKKKIAVLIPCFNEELTIAKVIKDFKKELPDSDIYVFDNNSTDKTAEIAKKNGAIVKKELRQGKGFVVEAMFRKIEADTYIMIDGDDTYPINEVQKLLKFHEDGYDLVCGDRLSNGTYAKENKRGFHGFGNWLVKTLINKLFNVSLKDVMTGYRVFSRNFVKNYPVLCDGFQVETDMTVFALDRNYSLKEVSIDFKDRPDGSESKLNTYSDGFKVLLTIFNLYRHYKPIYFFSIIACIFFVLSLMIGVSVIDEYIKYKFIYKVPSAVLSASLMLISFLSFTTGLILDSVRRSSRELLALNKK